MVNRNPEETPIIYYTNELEDEFSKAEIIPKRIDGTYSYEGGILRKIGRVFWYHILAKPLAFLFLKLRFGHKMINRKCLKQISNTGFFLYGNHTNAMADALIPTFVSHPASTYVIVHANNVSMPFLGNITPSLGALPLPDDKEAVKNFHKAIEHKIQKKKCIAIYPEAHIWPYYTKIRKFKDSSLRYPVQLKVPVFCFTNTYQKRKFRKTPKMVTYIDGPFFPDSSLSIVEQRKKLHREILNTMRERCKNSNVEMIRYEPAIFRER